MTSKSALLSITVVDDDRNILSVVKTGLEQAGFKVHGFTDPLEAIWHIEVDCKSCNLLITDVRMPKMSGFELIRRIRKLRPEMRVVIMTAFEISLSELNMVLPSTRVSNVIRKPFESSELLKIVKSLYASENSESAFA